MLGIFSFIKHPILGLLEKSNQLIPGLEKAVALYYNDNLSQLQCKGIKLKQPAPLIDDFFINDESVTQKLRNRKIQYQWMSTNNLPFETQQNEKNELNIFDELNNIVLCLGFNNVHDNKTDLLFLYLNHNKGNFGISNSSNNLSTSEKTIIGTMVYNTLNVYLNQHLSDGETLKYVNNRIKLLQEENENLKRNLFNLKENYLSSIVESCNTHLQNISLEYGVKFILSADAIDKLQYFSGNIETLKEKLTKSALLALNMNFGQQTSDIVLKAWDLDFTDNKNNSEAINQIDVHERYRKTLYLLNKLENAARVVINKQKGLTSENVGNACPTPITAPAISDALKNHQKKLIKLMNEYPDKWPTIRNEFRPVKNILHSMRVS